MIPRWFVWTTLALLSWGAWAILSKALGDALTATQSQALSTLGLFPIMLALGFTGHLTFSTANWRGLLYAFGAGALACAGNVSYYRVLHLGEKVAPVVALTALYPLITILLALIFLKERMNRVQIAGLALSLIAIYLFNVQNPQGLASRWLFLALLPIGFWGCAGLLQKLATNHISGELSTFWFLIAFVPTALLILLNEPWPGSLTSTHWTLVTALGFTFALGNFALLAALARGGKASVVVPLTGLYPAVSIPLAMIFWQERLGTREAVGILLALTAVIALSMESPAPLTTRAPELKSKTL